MAGICSNSTTLTGGSCDHRIVTAALDGESLEERFNGADFDAIDWNGSLPEQWKNLSPKRLFVLLGVKYLRNKGVLFPDLIGRVVNGEEATNVKAYEILSRDITKTNIGTSYVAIPPGINGERVLIDFTGCTQYRVAAYVNVIGTGQVGIRLVKDSDSTVLREDVNVGAAGERVVDSGWQTLPGGFTGEMAVRLQGKSTVASDDPIYRRCTLYLK